MDTPHELYDETFTDLFVQAAKLPLQSQESSTAMKNLETFSKCRPPALEPEPTPEPPTEPLTRWGKAKAGVAGAWDNETTRVLIKAGGTFGGVALVVWSTIRKDHVMDRQAMSQANQNNS